MFEVTRHLAALALLTSIPPVNAGTAPSDHQANPVEAAMEAFGKGEYLAAELMLRRQALRADGSYDGDYAGQMWEQTHAAIADWLPPHRRSWLDASPKDQQAIEQATFVDAIDEIVRRARHTRVVILNESHSDSRTRAFGLEVARALRPLGYDILALETLNNTPNDTANANRMQLISQRGALVRGDGFYTLDPVFADFVRAALTMGYNPMAYEATSYDNALNPDQQIASRERQEADNLFRRTLRDRPAAKLLIYVGYSHVAKAPIGNDGAKRRWMAARLKAISGIDPLTIDQTTIRLPDPPLDNDPRSGELARRIGRHSVVAMTRNGPLVLGPYAGAVDLQVIHPVAEVIHGRPDWLAGMGLVPIPVPAALMPSGGERLIQLFAAADPADGAIPLDQVLVTAGQAPPAMMTPPGVSVRFGVQDPPRDLPAS